MAVSLDSNGLRLYDIYPEELLEDKPDEEKTDKKNNSQLGYKIKQIIDQIEKGLNSSNIETVTDQIANILKDEETDNRENIIYKIEDIAKSLNEPSNISRYNTSKNYK